MKEKVIHLGKRPAIDIIKKELGIGLVGAEIGVNKGHNAAYICTIIQPKILYCIDPWNNFFDSASGEIIGEAQYIMAKELLQPFSCCKIIRDTSFNAVKAFDNENLDFVYIDGDHSYWEVLSDIARWYPIVKKGGILAGHDFQQVKDAVTEFCARTKISQLYTQDEDYWLKKE